MGSELRKRATETVVQLSCRAKERGWTEGSGREGENERASGSASEKLSQAERVAKGMPPCLSRVKGQDWWREKACVWLVV